VIQLLLVEELYQLTSPSRLRGHRDQITCIKFLSGDSLDLPSTSTVPVVSPGFLLTSAKDTFLKLWDLSTRHCVQTVVAHRAEVWSFDLNPSGDIIFTGSAEGELKAWSIAREAMQDGLKENEEGEVGVFLWSSISVHFTFQSF
jgi:U3 small nucleolar RNA-associated protein 12